MAIPYGALADAVLLGHLAFILLVIFGGLPALRWPRAVLLHLPAFLWGLWVQVSGRPCPLTPLENRLRLAAGESAYDTGFIEHYIASIIYPPGLTRSIQIGMGIALVIGNAAVYAWVWRRARAC